MIGFEPTCFYISEYFILNIASQLSNGIVVEMARRTIKHYLQGDYSIEYDRVFNAKFVKLTQYCCIIIINQT